MKTQKNIKQLTNEQLVSSHARLRVDAKVNMTTEHDENMTLIEIEYIGRNYHKLIANPKYLDYLRKWEYEYNLNS